MPGLPPRGPAQPDPQQHVAMKQDNAGKKGPMTSPDITVQNVIDDLDSFYCHNIVASLWADAVANRLEGMAIYLLSDELPEVAGHARAAGTYLLVHLAKARPRRPAAASSRPVCS